MVISAIARACSLRAQAHRQRGLLSGGRIRGEPIAGKIASP
jgi:hypothetical protein